MDKVQLSLKENYGGSDDVKKVIAQEMAQVRKSQGLPKLSAASNAAIQSASSRVDGAMDKLPRVPGAMGDKMQSARRGAALASVLGNAGLDKQLAKEEMERKKRNARLKQLGRHASQQSGNPNPKDKSQKGELSRQRSSRVEANTNYNNSKQHPPALMAAPSRRYPAGSAPMSRAMSMRTINTGRSSQRFLNSMPSVKRYIGSSLLADIREVHGIRDDSRVGKLLADFGDKDDWVSTTVLRHKMATILQANIRGWLLRLRWWANPEQVVILLHSRLKAEATEADRRAKLRRTLELRSLSSKQKKTVTNVMSKLFGSKVLQGAPVNPLVTKIAAGRWGKLQKNADIVVSDGKGERSDLDKAVEQGHDPDGITELLGSDNDSEFSDLEMEDITAVKMRAKTPPWQRQEESQWVGQYNKLTKSKAHSSLEMRWDLDACADRLEACKTRWRERHQTQEQQDAEDAAYDVVEQPLPAEVINRLLYPKYVERMIRLGLMEPEDVIGTPPPEEETPQSASATAPIPTTPPAAPAAAAAPVVAPALAPAAAPEPAQ